MLKSLSPSIVTVSNDFKRLRKNLLDQKQYNQTSKIKDLNFNKSINFKNISFRYKIQIDIFLKILI